MLDSTREALRVDSTKALEDLEAVDEDLEAVEARGIIGHSSSKKKMQLF